jgi:hypothetical protein
MFVMQTMQSAAAHEASNVRFIRTKSPNSNPSENVRKKFSSDEKQPTGCFSLL